MNPKLTLFIQELREIIAKYDQPAFGCIYGSYPCLAEHSKSDLDFFVATQKYDNDFFKLLKDFVVWFHHRHSIPLDEEVPYENKLLVTYEDIESAINLEPFRDPKWWFKVNLIKKTDTYLSSLEIRHRLLLNALTTPHCFVWNDKVMYENSKTVAEKSIVILGKYLYWYENADVEDIFRALTVSADWRSGEEFLGYKPRPTTVVNLRKIITKNIIQYADLIY